MSSPAKPDLRETSATGRLQLGMAGGGALRWAVADVTGVVEEARGRLDLSPVAAAALGRCLAGASLLLRLAAKTPTRLVLEIRGDGPLGRVIAEADQEGNLRGMVGDPHVDVPPTPAGKLAVGRAVGKGLLRVLREHAGGGSYHSQVELVSGEIGEDVAHYLEQSEQSRSAVLLGVLAKPFGIAAAGGMIVEVLPGAPEDTVARLEQNIAGTPGVSHLVEVGGSGHVIETLLAGFDREVRETRPLRYRCRCSRERLLHHLVLLPADDREHLRSASGTIEADCVFCGSRYVYTPEELGPAAE
ncbi:MAG TPA: Hsp33 family molecular chaperone HslO [Thermoanaerobaculia bacterium]|nr:Hsp33 family molecular chaperone HslO [Thermoanaerobaculia bacterium]